MARILLLDLRMFFILVVANLFSTACVHPFTTLKHLNERQTCADCATHWSRIPVLVKMISTSSITAIELANPSPSRPSTSSIPQMRPSGPLYSTPHIPATKPPSPNQHADTSTAHNHSTSNPPAAAAAQNIASAASLNPSKKNKVVSPAGVVSASSSTTAPYLRCRFPTLPPPLRLRLLMILLLRDLKTKCGRPGIGFWISSGHMGMRGL